MKISCTGKYCKGREILILLDHSDSINIGTKCKLIDPLLSQMNMASATTEDLIKCNICLDKLKSPRALPCLHSFCEVCLQQHVRITQNTIDKSKSHFPCPTCRSLSKLPKDGVKGFPIDFRINQINDVLETISNKSNPTNLTCEMCVDVTHAIQYCTDCKKYFCRNCGTKHQMSKVLKSHVLINVYHHDNEAWACKTHKKEPIKFFCKECDIGICLFCVLGNHQHHIISSNEDLYATKKNCLVNCLTHINNQISFLNGRIFDITCKEGQIRSKYMEEKLTQRSPCHSQGSLDKYSDFLDISYKSKCHHFKKEKDHCYEYLLQFKMIKNKLESIKESGNSQILLDFHSHILEEVQTIDVKSQINQFELELNSFEKTSHTFHFLSVLEQRRGLMLGADNLSDKKINMESARVLNIHRGNNTTTDEKLKYYLEKSFRSPFSNCLNQLSTMVLPQQPYNPAKYQSDTSTAKVKCLYRIGGCRRFSSPLNLPFGITFLAGDILVVAENGSGRIQKFDRFGKCIESKRLTSGYPRCVTVGRNNEIFLTDEHNKCITQILRDGETKINLSKDLIHFPYGIATLGDDNLVVSDMIYERLSIIKPTGEIVLQFGCHGNKDSDFDNPSYIATDGYNILVSDSGHHQVKVFDKLGNFIHKIGSYGSNNGELKYPKGIAVTNQGSIIIADSGNNRVVMFSKTGDFVTNLLDINDNIDRPIDVACTTTGLLAVAMPDKHEVTVYKLN